MKKNNIIWGILALFWCIFIFYMSSQNGTASSEPSDEIARFIAMFVTGGDKTAEIPESYKVLVRKTAHVLEYMTLGFVVFKAFSIKNTRVIKTYIYTLAFCMVYAASDEIHQYFVPGRVMLFTDWLIDSGGIIAGSAIAWACKKFYLQYIHNVIKNI